MLASVSPVRSAARALRFLWQMQQVLASRLVLREHDHHAGRTVLDTLVTLPKKYLAWQIGAFPRHPRWSYLQFNRLHLQRSCGAVPSDVHAPSGMDVKFMDSFLINLFKYNPCQNLTNISLSAWLTTGTRHNVSPQCLVSSYRLLESSGTMLYKKIKPAALHHRLSFAAKSATTSTIRSSATAMLLIQTTTGPPSCCARHPRR